MAASNRRPRRWTSSTRRSTAAAWPASSSSSVALRAVIRASVSSLMRAISALRPLADRGDVLVGLRLEGVLRHPWTRRGSPRRPAASRYATCSSVWAWAVSAVARIAADRSTISWDGFLRRGRRGGRDATCRSWESVLGVGQGGSGAPRRGRCSASWVRPRAALKSVWGQAGSAGSGSAGAASSAATASAASGAARRGSGRSSTGAGSPSGYRLTPWAGTILDAGQLVSGLLRAP